MARVAVAQLDPVFGEPERNLETCIARLEEAAAAGAELLVLPECAIPGYMFDSLEEGLELAEECPARPSRRSSASVPASACTPSAGCSSATATGCATRPCSSAPTV